MAGRRTTPAPGQTPQVKQATHGSCRDGPTAASAHRPLLASTNPRSIEPSGVRTPRTGRSGCSHTSWRDHRTHTPNRRESCQIAGPRLMTVRDGLCGQVPWHDSRELATLVPGGRGRAVAAVSAACNGPPITGARTCWHGLRSPLYDVMPRHLQSGDYLAWIATAFRGNALDAGPARAVRVPGCVGRGKRRFPGYASRRPNGGTRDRWPRRRLRCPPTGTPSIPHIFSAASGRSTIMPYTDGPAFHDARLHLRSVPGLICSRRATGVIAAYSDG